MKLSRVALYELVWSQPMTQIARFYGVRDLKIAQACDFWDIARPPSGYWQKLAHGKKVEKIDLQTATYSKSDSVTIEPSGATKRPHRVQGKPKNRRKENKQDQSLWHKHPGL